MYPIWEKLDPKEKGYLLGFYLLSLAVVGLLAYGVGRGQNVVSPAIGASVNATPPAEVIPLESNPEPPPAETEPASAPPQDSPLVVHVAGAVKKPGVYTLPSGSRVADAIEQAGGARADADTNALNLAEALQDGQQVYVPAKTETHAEPSPARKTASSTPPAPARKQVRFPIDLNRASAEELEQLPGIGAVLAQRIVEYRQQVGRFQSVDELRNVRGIGPKRLEQIRPLVVVR
ncbi:competence protein ComEA [Armatimonadetes bacterium GXS]|nr:ComE operon protein 1 [bacterium HR14]CUU34654.1 competence protein ComEA [Armatimonadetes bacterium GXS]